LSLLDQTGRVKFSALKGEHMKLKGFFRVAGVCALASAAMLAVAGPAIADPTSPTTTINLDGAGSDTTQDVIDRTAKDAGYSSWNAFQPGSNPPVVHDAIDVKAGATCTDVSRPNGSGEGVTALRRSLSGTPGYPATTAATYAGTKPAPIAGLCFDFARSSSGPGSNASTSGLLQYIPFALDGVSVAVGPATGANATNIASSFTLAQLQAMYSAGTNVVGTDGVTYDPNPANGTTGTAIHLLIPQAGSGTRSFFAGVVGINATTPPAWVKDTFIPTGGTVAESVQEHNGSAVTLDHNAIVPFSIAQWISQKNHPAIDRRAEAVLQNVGTTSPLDATGTKLNVTFQPQLLRDVFNVIPFAATTDTASALYKVFVSTTDANRLCGRTNRITEYGFATIGSRCGQLTSANRAYSTTQW